MWLKCTLVGLKVTNILLLQPAVVLDYFPINCNQIDAVGLFPTLLIYLFTAKPQIVKTSKILRINV